MPASVQGPPKGPLATSLRAAVQPASVYLCIRSGLGLGFTRTLTTSLALHLSTLLSRLSSAGERTQSSRLSCQAAARLLTARSNLGTPRETPHGDRHPAPRLHSRSLLTYLSGSPRCAARTRASARATAPAPNQGKHTLTWGLATVPAASGT